MITLYSFRFDWQDFIMIMVLLFGESVGTLLAQFWQQQVTMGKFVFGKVLFINHVDS